MTDTTDTNDTNGDRYPVDDNVLSFANASTDLNRLGDVLCEIVGECGILNDNGDDVGALVESFRALTALVESFREGVH